MSWAASLRGIALALALGVLAVGHPGAAASDGVASNGDQYLRVAPIAGTVALTFDDGPDPSTTLRLLDLLDQLDVRATFFVMGWRVDEHPELAAEIAARGHSVQIHSYFHTAFTSLSDAGIRDRVQRTAESIHAATGAWPVCVRPPYGATSSRVNRVIESMGYRVVGWSVNSLDSDYRSAAIVVSRLRRVGAGANVLGHDTLRLWIEALPEVVGNFRSHGVGLSAICEMTAMTPRPETR